MTKYLLSLSLPLLLAACPSLDETTGLSKEQRCANYRTLVANAKVLEQTLERQKRIATYEALITVNCPPVQ